MFTPLNVRARGRWAEILPRLGLDRKFLSGKHGGCPFCGGKDRWRFINKEGSGNWVCNQCGRGDGVELAKRVLKADFRAVALRVEELIGTTEATPVRVRDEDACRKAMATAWRMTRPITAHDPAGQWLARRGLPIEGEPLPSLRFAESRYYDARLHFPAMLAKVISPDDQAVNLHQTFLTPDGEKAAVERPRKMMPGTVPLGSAVRLMPAGSVLGVGEGIETVLAAARLFRVPVWSTLNAANLEAFREPAGVEELIVLGDNDASMAGQAAAYGLAKKARARGVKVRVEIPPEVGADWNDALLERGDQ